ncbi:hypothetical protein C7S13_5920 [Burkholderia cepacia]|nr:hypothetical protein [Burkholderia cepacia]
MRGLPAVFAARGAVAETVPGPFRNIAQRAFHLPHCVFPYFKTSYCRHADPVSWP